MKVKIITSVISALSVLIVTPVYAETVLSDVKGHWADSYIQKAVVRGYVNGFEDGTFKPDDFISADAFIKMLIASLIEKDSSKGKWNEGWLTSLTVANKNTLTQVSNTIPLNENSSGYWAKRYIDRADAMGIISYGTLTNENEFEKMITRENASAILGNFISIYEGVDSSLYLDTARQAITDSTSISPDKLRGVEEVITKGIIKGYEDRTFRPNNYITRAEAVKIIEATIDKNERSVFTPDLSNSFYVKEGDKIILFGAKEFKDGVGLIEGLTDGQADINNKYYKYFPDKEKYEFAFGIDDSYASYKMEVTTKKVYLTNKEYNSAVNYLFGEDASIFNEALSHYVESYAKAFPAILDKKDFMINGRGVSLNSVGGTNRVQVSFSEKR